MTEKLRTCPFCGGEAKLETYGGTACAVVCQSCHCGTPTMSLADGMAAVSRWNLRVDRTCRIVKSVDKNPASYGGLVHRCSSCGKAFPKQFFNNGWTRLNYCPTCGARVTGTIFKEGE